MSPSSKVKSPKSMSRGNGCLAEAIQLEVVDAHVIALAHADVEFHARLVDDVVETEVVFAAEHGAVRSGGAGGVDAQHGLDVTLEIGAAHVEVVGNGAGDLERFGLERLAGLEHRLGLLLARPVLDRLCTVPAPQRASRVQKAQKQDQPKAHSIAPQRALDTGPRHDLTAWEWAPASRLKRRAGCDASVTPRMGTGTVRTKRSQSPHV